MDFEPFCGVMPDDWREVELGEVAILSAGGDKPAVCSPTPNAECTVPIFSNGVDSVLFFRLNRRGALRFANCFLAHYNSLKYRLNCINISLAYRRNRNY